MADLRQIERALCWVESRLPSFDPFPRNKPDYRRLKAFGELTLMFLYLSEWASDLGEKSPVVNNFCRRCFLFIKEHCERSVYLEAARKNPLRAEVFVLPYLYLRTKGYRSPRHEQLMHWLSGFCLPQSVELLPYREWGRQHFLWKSGWVNDQPPWRRYYKPTALAMRKGTIYWDMLEAYGIAHTVFYMTDFGRLSVPLPDRERARVGLKLRSLLIHYWRLKNWDLTAELLLSLLLLGFSQERCVIQASATLDKLLRKDGTLPADGRPNKRRSRRDKRKRRKITSVDSYTLDCYHPTFVWLLYAITKCSCNAQI